MGAILFLFGFFILVIYAEQIINGICSLLERDKRPGSRG
jgi:hypothetical protein